MDSSQFIISVHMKKRGIGKVWLSFSKLIAEDIKKNQMPFPAETGKQ